MPLCIGSPGQPCCPLFLPIQDTEHHLQTSPPLECCKTHLFDLASHHAPTLAQALSLAGWTWHGKHSDYLKVQGSQEWRPCEEDILCIIAVKPGLPHRKFLQAFAVGRLKSVCCKARRSISNTCLSAIAMMDIKVQQCHSPDSCTQIRVLAMGH